MRAALAVSAFVLSVLWPPFVLAQSPAPGKEETPTVQPAQEQQQDEKDQPGIRFVMARRPSLRFGRWLRIDFRAKFQGDVRRFSPDLDTREGSFDLHRKRLGVQGQLLRHFEFELERELQELDEQRVDPEPEDLFTPLARNPWRDVFVNVRYFDDFQIRAGKFKLPFGMEQLTSPTDLDFVHRSLISTQLAPARDRGVALHGRFLQRGLSYELGLFDRDGERARSSDNPGADRTVAGRVTGRPFRLIAASPAVRELEIGLAMTTSEVPRGPLRNSLEGRTVAGKTFFDRVYVQGRRLRVGAEANWSPGPISVKGELVQVQDERERQGLGNADLPDVIARGWYVSGTWAVTGEKKADGIEPRRDFLRGGIGAIELAARYEQLRFSSRPHPEEPPSRSPRAATILPNRDRVWTFGVNWYPNRYVKLQLNALREQIDDVERRPIPEREQFWTGVFRFQFVL